LIVPSNTTLAYLQSAYICVCPIGTQKLKAAMGGARNLKLGVTGGDKGQGTGKRGKIFLVWPKFWLYSVVVCMKTM